MICFMSTLTQHPTPQLPKLPIKLHHQTTFFANMYIEMFSSCRTFIDCSFVKIQGRSTLHFVWLIHPCFCQFSWRSMNLVHSFSSHVLPIGSCCKFGKNQAILHQLIRSSLFDAVDSVEFLLKILPFVVVVSENRSSKCSVLSKAND